MEEIERYEINDVGDIRLSDSGYWCLYSDVEKIIKQNKDLIETIQAMIKIGEAVK